MPQLHQGTGAAGASSADVPAFFQAETIATVPADADAFVSRSVFSPAYRHVAYAVKTNSGKQVVMVDGLRSKPYDEIVWGPYLVPSNLSDAFASWGPYLGPAMPAYIVRTGKVFRVVIEGKEGRPYDGIDASTPRLLRDGSMAYIATRKNQSYVVFHNHEYGPFTEVDQAVGFVVSPDGEHVAFVAWTGRKGLVGIDGATRGSYDEVSTPVFSPDGRHVAYAAAKTDGTKVLVIDQREMKPRSDRGAVAGPPVFCWGGRGSYAAEWPDKTCEEIGHATQSMSSSSVQFSPQVSGSSGRNSGAIREVAEYDVQEQPVYSADGGHVAFIGGRKKAATSGGNRSGTQSLWYFVMVDGRELGPYDEVWTPIFATDSASVIFAIYRAEKGEFVRMTYRVR